MLLLFLFLLTNLSICDRLQVRSINDRQRRLSYGRTEIRLGGREVCRPDLATRPMTTKELVVLCEKELNWKRTTTYTVLKKLCNQGIFCTEEGLVTVVTTKEDFHAMQSEKFVEETFEGSLPAFIAAFASRKKPSEQELAEIRKLLDAFSEESK